jgi:16S rRNA (cytosine1402-N4)-methyltransferase
MLEETLYYLEVKESGIYVDCTLGDGGHSQAILEKIKTGKLIAFEWDEKAVELIQENKSFFSDLQFKLINDNFANLEKHLEEQNIKEVDGFLFDLGLSSSQLAQENRGFSYRLNSPLDMRISKETKLKAEEIINNHNLEKLADIFYHYGEEKKARIIARKICHHRAKKRITTTQQLISIIASCFLRKSNKHPARRVFQALRIAVNQELINLTCALEIAIQYLGINGKIVVISYHSLEDRIVKQMFRKYAKIGDCIEFNKKAKLNLKKFRIITKKPLIPSPAEITHNHRSRSAKMRVLRRDF